eukprot:7118990-Alexandrium_andersonii.AAC.1
MRIAAITATGRVLAATQKTPDLEGHSGCLRRPENGGIISDMPALRLSELSARVRVGERRA